MEKGNEGMVDDLLPGARAWGFAPADITVPVLILHGALDRMVPCAHGEWLAAHCPTAEFRLASGAGHITVLDSAPAALQWLRDRVAVDLASCAETRCLEDGLGEEPAEVRSRPVARPVAARSGR